jgi:hypothetical protein
MLGRLLIAFSTMTIFVIVITFWFDLTTSKTEYYLLLPLIISLFHLTTPPLFRFFGLYKYLSPMLLVNNPTKSQYDLHSGTSFDYLINISRFRKHGVKRILLKDYLIGLLKIIEKVENGSLPESVTIKGSSYFFSESTAHRFGFSVVTATMGERLNAVINYLDLIWMYSLANKKLTFPNLSKMKRATIKGNILLSKKQKIQEILSRIEKYE